MIIIFRIASILFLIADGMIAFGGILEVLGGIWSGLLTAIFGLTSLMVLTYVLRYRENLRFATIIAGLNLGFSAADAHATLIVATRLDWEALNSAVPSLILFVLSLIILVLCWSHRPMQED